jgi:hypothetical protein
MLTPDQRLRNVLSVPLTDREHEALTLLARERGRTLAAYARRILQQHLHTVISTEHMPQLHPEEAPRP